MAARRKPRVTPSADRRAHDHPLVLGAWRSAYGLPDRIAAVDGESTGLDLVEDRLVNVGWCTGSLDPADPGHERFRVIDWTRVLDRPALDALARRMDRTRAHMAARGNTYDWTIDYLAGVGVHPTEAAAAFLADCRGLALVAHNGWKFDFPMYGRFLHDWGAGLDIAEEALVDTAMLHKAVVSGTVPYPGEDYRQYNRRLDHLGCGRFSMQTCIDYYGLAAGGAKKANQHDAGYDSWLVYCLYREMVVRAGSA